MAAHFSYTLTVQLEYTNHLLQFSKLFSYYAGIMLNAFSDLLCSKLCWHNRLVPRPVILIGECRAILIIIKLHSHMLLYSIYCHCNVEWN